MAEVLPAISCGPGNPMNAVLSNGSRGCGSYLK